MEEERTFEEILEALQSGSKKRDPRAVRLAAVTAAVLEVVGEDHPSAAQVYSKIVTTLEGTLLSDLDHNKPGSFMVESLATQVALLELFSQTVPHVEPVAILSATLPLTSRVLRAVVTSSQDADASNEVLETKDELGGVNALLRWNCRAVCEYLKRLCGPVKVDIKAIQQLFSSTLLLLFQDHRPKVRKAALHCTLEILSAENEGSASHIAVVNLMTTHAHKALSTKSRDKETMTQLLHLLPFLETAVIHLNCDALGRDCMELLLDLFRDDARDARDVFVAVAKIQDITPRILTISALLSVVMAMLEDTSPKNQPALDQMAPRVLASLLQANPLLIFRKGNADFNVLQRGRTLYGQTLLVALRRTLDSNAEISAKFLSPTLQLVVKLCRPAVDEEPDDTSVAQVLLAELTQLFRSKLPPLLLAARNQLLAKCLQDSLISLGEVMQPSYRPTWSISLKTLVVLIEYIYETIDVQATVQALVDLRTQAEADAASQQAAEDSWGMLVQALGVEVCWKWIYVEPSAESHKVALDQAWVFAKLKSAGMSAQPMEPRLEFFQREVLGSARAYDKLASTVTSHKHIYQARVIDLWSLFPCFCQRPIDLDAIMPTLSVTLGKALEDNRYPQLMVPIGQGLSQLVASLIESEQEEGGVGLEVMQAASQRLLPVLFKKVTEAPAPVLDSGSDELSELTKDSALGYWMESAKDAVTSLGRVAPRPFLHNLFQKLMHRLIDELQLRTSGEGKICTYLSLCESLLKSGGLDEHCVSLLYRTIKPTLRSDKSSPRVQKRAYKMLALLCEQNHELFADEEHFRELATLLSGTTMTSHVAARHLRLKCLQAVAANSLQLGNRAIMKMVIDLVPEVLLCLKDSNVKTREAAYHLLLSIAKCDDDGLVRELLHVLSAALGAETAHMRSASIMALSRIVHELATENQHIQPILPSLFKTVLVLSQENSREVVKSVIGFIRVAVAAIPRESLKPIISDLVTSLLTYHKVKDRFRSKVKIIIKKLVKYFGFEEVATHVPFSESRLLTHMRKLSERQKRKQESGSSAVSKSHQFDSLIESDEEDSDDDGLTLTSGVSKSKSRTSSAASRKSKALSEQGARAKGNDLRLPNELDGHIVDMLDARAVKKVRFVSEEEPDEVEYEDTAMEFDEDGKLIVLAEDQVEKEVDLLTLSEKHRDGKGSTNGNRKSTNANSDKNRVVLGAAFKARKAGGDVKRKGAKYEPYAYVPLSGRSYSKKNRQTTVEQMSSVVRKRKHTR